MEKYQETECSCPKCVDMCRRRMCWPTPEEAKKLIIGGYADSLLRDWLDEPYIELLTPANKGYEGRTVAFLPETPCTFLTEANLCELHDLKLKPLEGRVASCKDLLTAEIHKKIARMWQTTKGEQIVSKWLNSR